MQANARQCGIGSSAVSGADAMACLSTHERETGQVAAFCVTAAENHYEASSTLQGYAADRELLQGATYLGLAATANGYLGRRDLAAQQIKSVITMASRVKSAPDAGDLGPLAAKELTWADGLLQALTASR